MQLENLRMRVNASANCYQKILNKSFEIFFRGFLSAMRYFGGGYARSDAVTSSVVNSADEFESRGMNFKINNWSVFLGV